MKIVNLSEQNTIVNLYMSEIRDRKYQQNRMLFRNNIRRIGEMMAYELSKTLEYKTKNVTTPLGNIDIPLPKDDIIVATVLRAGLPFHEGFLRVFDHADNAFVSAYRMYTNREHTEVGVHAEYMAAPSTKNKTLIVADPMLATGGSMAAAYEALLHNGKPARVHIACVIAFIVSTVFLIVTTTLLISLPIKIMEYMYVPEIELLSDIFGCLRRYHRLVRCHRPWYERQQVHRARLRRLR